MPGITITKKLNLYETLPQKIAETFLTVWELVQDPDTCWGYLATVIRRVPDYTPLISVVLLEVMG